MFSPQAAASYCPNDPQAYFGGPDRAPGLLRDLLEARIAATPGGGAIRWAVYYFNDEKLAEALMRASDRGVDVRLVLEGAPHHVAANRTVVRALRAHGLGGGLRVLHNGLPFSHPLHMHAKVYVFRHRRGSALTGSYNPLNGDVGGVKQSLGDHDRGHNLLVEAVDDAAIDALGRYVDRLFDSRGWVGVRRHPHQNQIDRAAQIDFHYFPRQRTCPIGTALKSLGGGDSVQGCVSHIDDGPVAASLAAAAARGARVALHLGSLGRRVSASAVRRLQAAGADLTLYDGPASRPMHCKFLILRSATGSQAYFGTFNLNVSSRWLNHEVLACTASPSVVAALDDCFRELHSRASPAFEGTC